MMQYEDKFGVKVDVQIPEGVRTKIYAQWERWKHGMDGHTSIEKVNLQTRYEHHVLGSGCGIPPDPFKPLCAQHEGADLKAIIEARLSNFPPGQKYRGSIYSSHIKDFEVITGLDKFFNSSWALYPEVDVNGRIRIPKIVEVHGEDNVKIDLDDATIARLQLPTSRVNLKWDEAMLREVFDFDNGYRIELVEIIKK